MNTSPLNVGKKPGTPITTSLRDFLRRQSWPHIVHLQEVKIKPSDEDTKAGVENAVNHCRSGKDDGPQYVVRFCLPRDAYNATRLGGRLYGVATIIRADFLEACVTDVREVDWDQEGRVLVVETRQRLSIWNIYAVNGTTSPYRDSLTGKVIGTRHDKKLAFHKALIDECKQLEDQGWKLVLAGDFNVAREQIDGFPKLRTKPEQHIKNREDFNRKFFDDEAGLRMMDSFRYLNPKKRRYTWLPRTREWRTSCDRVDYVLCSRQLLDGGHVVGADILMTEADRGPSDHVPIFVSLDGFLR